MAKKNFILKPYHFHRRGMAFPYDIFSGSGGYQEKREQTSRERLSEKCKPKRKKPKSMHPLSDIYEEEMNTSLANMKETKTVFELKLIYNSVKALQDRILLFFSPNPCPEVGDFVFKNMYFLSKFSMRPPAELYFEGVEHNALDDFIFTDQLRRVILKEYGKEFTYTL